MPRWLEYASLQVNSVSPVECRTGIKKPMGFNRFEFLIARTLGRLFLLRQQCSTLLPYQGNLSSSRNVHFPAFIRVVADDGKCHFLLPKKRPTKAGIMAETNEVVFCIYTSSIFFPSFRNGCALRRLNISLINYRLFANR